MKEKRALQVLFFPLVKSLPVARNLLVNRRRADPAGACFLSGVLPGARHAIQGHAAVVGVALDGWPARAVAPWTGAVPRSCAVSRTCVPLLGENRKDGCAWRLA